MNKLMESFTTRASVFSLRHKVVATDGLFSLLTHRKDFLPLLLPPLLQYTVGLISRQPAALQRHAATPPPRPLPPPAETPHTPSISP